MRRPGAASLDGDRRHRGERERHRDARDVDQRGDEDAERDEADHPAHHAAEQLGRRRSAVALVRERREDPGVSETTSSAVSAAPHLRWEPERA